MTLIRDFLFYNAVCLGLALMMTAPFDMRALTLSQTIVLFIGNLALYFVVLWFLERLHQWIEQKLRASDHRL